MPADSHLEIEAKVSNHDIGFVHSGQDAEIKIDTFSFTKYGLLHGRVEDVSEDAVPMERPQSKAGMSSDGSAGSASEPRGEELSYLAHVSLDRAQIQVEEGPQISVRAWP